MLEKTPESPLDSKEIKLVNHKGNQPLILIGRIDAKAPILRPLEANSRLLRKNLMLGKIEGRRGQQRMKWLDGITDSMDMNLGKLREMGRGREAWWAASPWGHKESDMTWKLNNNNVSADLQRWSLSFDEKVGMPECPSS